MAGIHPAIFIYRLKHFFHGHNKVINGNFWKLSIVRYGRPVMPDN